MKKIVLVNHTLPALVSDQDFSIVRRYRWYLVHKKRNPKVAARVKTQTGWRWIYLHRMVLGLDPLDKREVDHRKGDGLNNTRRFLRACSRSENLRGYRKPKSKKFLSRYRGVTYCKRQKKFLAQIRLHLGYFKNEVDAAKAYDKAAKRLYKRFATPNF